MPKKPNYYLTDRFPSTRYMPGNGYGVRVILIPGDVALLKTLGAKLLTKSRSATARYCVRYALDNGAREASTADHTRAEESLGACLYTSVNLEPSTIDALSTFAMERLELGNMGEAVRFFLHYTNNHQQPPRSLTHGH